MSFVWTEFGVLAPPLEDEAYLYAVNTLGDRRKISKRAYLNHSVIRTKLEALIGKPVALRTSQNTGNWPTSIWFSDVSMSAAGHFSEPETTSDNEIESLQTLNAKIIELERLVAKSNEDLATARKSDAEHLDAAVDKTIVEFDSEIDTYQKAFGKQHSIYDPKTIRFLATANMIEKNTPANADLDWSAPVIMLCKAVENELVKKFLMPLKQIASLNKPEKLEINKKAKKVEDFLSGMSERPPELGGIVFFIKLLAESRSFSETAWSAQLMQVFASQHIGANWYLNPNGASPELQKILGYRNPAAHIETINQKDFFDSQACTIGENGVLPKIAMAAL